MSSGVQPFLTTFVASAVKAVAVVLERPR